MKNYLLRAIVFGTRATEHISLRFRTCLDIGNANESPHVWEQARNLVIAAGYPYYHIYKIALEA